MFKFKPQLRLVIYSMGEVDFGEYTCEAKNNRGVGRTHIHISGNCLLVCPFGPFDLCKCLLVISKF